MEEIRKKINDVIESYKHKDRFSTDDIRKSLIVLMNEAEQVRHEGFYICFNTFRANLVRNMQNKESDFHCFVEKVDELGSKGYKNLTDNEKEYCKELIDVLMTRSQ